MKQRLSSDLYERIEPYLLESLDGFDLLDWKKLKDDKDEWVARKGVALNDADRLYSRCVDILYSGWTSQDLPDSEEGDWHHLWPICVGGSECDARNFKKVSTPNHVLLHAALVVAFRYMAHLGLNYSLAMTTTMTSLSQEYVAELIANKVSPLCWGFFTYLLG